MITEVRIAGYRKFRELSFKPRQGTNIFVGDNECGKSTLIEAIGLALTGRVNNRPAHEELNPYWFNKKLVSDFFEKRRRGERVSPPTISVEIFFEDKDELQRLHGACNSRVPTSACAGLVFTIKPDPQYDKEIEAHFQSDSSIIPVEYYRVDWRSFADEIIESKPRELAVATIDSRTIRSSSTIDYHLRQMLGDHLEPEEKAAISLAYRTAKEQMTKQHLSQVSSKISNLGGTLGGGLLGLAMDQSARTSWDSHITPQVEGLPFANAGLGQQAAVKIAIALGRKGASANIVMIEEPENHLSHTSLNKLVRRIEELVVPGQQLFITTHSSFVLNRLGLDALSLVSGEQVSTMRDITEPTVDYFRKLPGYDTLRLVTADRIVLVEGPSDEIVLERFYRDKYGKRPVEDGIDVISLRSLSLNRYLELVSLLGKRCAAIRDLDKKDPDTLRSELKEWLLPNICELFLGKPENGATLEPQLITANEEELLRKVLKLKSDSDLPTWMTNNKTEAAIRIADAEESLNPPSYIVEAMEFVRDGTS